MDANKEYKDLLGLLNKSNRDDVYVELMKKEKDLLDVVNRIANSPLSKQPEPFLYNLSIVDLVIKLIATWKTIIEELFVYKNYNIKHVFWNGERKIYIGITLVIVALFLFFVDVSS